MSAPAPAGAISAARAGAHVAVRAWPVLLIGVSLCWLTLALAAAALIAVGALDAPDLIDPLGPGAGRSVTAGEVLALVAWAAPLGVLGLVVHPVAAVLSANAAEVRRAGFVRACLRDSARSALVAVIVLVATLCGAVVFLVPGIAALLIGLWAVPAVLVDRPARFDLLVDRCLGTAKAGGVRQAGSLLAGSLLISLLASTLFTALSPLLGLVAANVLIGPLAGMAWWMWVTLLYLGVHPRR